VTLSTERDALGQQRAQLDWRFTPIDIRTIVRAQEIISDELQKADLGTLVIELNGNQPPRDLHGGYHQMGTTRMDMDRRVGVVGADCRVHGTANLFIASSSVFPTVGYANPTMTIVALALRLADRVKEILE
jgi:choline dehydrogenase-like flavoprotein